MDTMTKMRLRGLATLFLISGMVTAVLSFLLSIALQRLSIGIATFPFAPFGAVTAVLTATWLRIDAKQAYEQANRSGCFQRNGTDMLIESMMKDCPKRWLVVLHLQLHPELTIIR